MPGALTQQIAIATGTHANRPPAATTTGFYWETDTGLLLFSDQIGWHPIGANAVPVFMAPGLYYFNQGQGQTGTGAPVNGEARWTPLQIPHDVTLTRIGVEITAAGTAGCTARLAIAADSGSGMPGALALDAGTIPGDVVQVAEIIINQALSAGSYWATAIPQGNPATVPTFRGINIAQADVMYGMAAIPTANQLISAWQETGLVGAIPAARGALTAIGGTPPRIFVKAA